MSYTARLIGGPRGNATLRLQTFFGHAIPTAPKRHWPAGWYVLESPPPTEPPCEQECLYRWQPENRREEKR